MLKPSNASGTNSLVQALIHGTPRPTETREGAAGGRRTRNPKKTRERLLLAAFGEIYKSGFRGTDIDTIIEKAKVTKGALYHHFDGKEALGYAMVDAVLMPLTEEKWLRPLREARDPLKTLAAIVRDTQLTAEAVNGGCPVNNLAQEMSPLDEEFRSRIAGVFRAWYEGVAEALRVGQKRGQVRRDFNAVDKGMDIVATYEGYISLAKNAQDPEVLRSGTRRLAKDIESLRVRGAADKRAKVRG